MGTIDLFVAEDAVGEIVFNRPDKKNALRNEDWRLLREQLERASTLPLRCLLLRGAGEDFCAGWDLGQARGEVDPADVINGFVNPALQTIRTFAKPTIAAVTGACLGGGLGIAMACDVVLAADTARLGSPFRNIGLLPDSGAHYVLRERLGHHKASQLIYTGKMIDGCEAARLGLVCEVYPAASLLEEARKMAAVIASGPTASFMASKRILLQPADYDETLAREAEGQARIFATADAKEGISAFLQKRKPVFVGQ
ncbi:enoyl-CoA hydratase/isomerase family protein [Rhodoligotrophos defluvii]|uniref:enoyl-CoA hydratase/isomerase family protein n=1 Tax=Rhodoligotrophos defluvii TaxID=2561934 RepID=UPI0010C97B8E|nr:enoyl-CoA hydratase-related protein [Rhodoligotrophos defluvii]